MQLGMPPPPNKQPQTVEELLDAMPLDDRLPFLAWAEQRYRQQGDLTMLRALKAYRAKHNL